MVSMAGLFALLRRASTRPRFTVPLVTLVFALVGVVGLGPVIQVHDLSGSPVASVLEKLLEAELKASKRSGSLSREIEPTWLTTGSVEVFAKWDETQKQVGEIEKKFRGPQVRADRLALLIASWLLAVLLLALGPSMASPSVGPSQQLQTVRLLAESILEKEADLARTHAQALYSRSTALLLGGILIAFLGVVVFYLALPEDSQNPVRAQKLLLAQTVLLGDSNFPIDLLASSVRGGRSSEEELFLRQRRLDELRRFEGRSGASARERVPSSIEKFAEKSPEHFASVVKEVLTPVSFNDMLSEHLGRTLRPFGILIFIEGIAWFLLRQYRALMEDYKSFYRGYLRRVNTLIAYKLLIENPTPTLATTTFVGELFSEDLSGRLKKDETTEQLEALRAFDEPNPVLQVVRKVVEKLSPGGKAVEKLSLGRRSGEDVESGEKDGKTP